MRLSLCTGMGGELEVAELLGLPLSCDNIVCVDNDPEVLDYLVKRFGQSNAYLMGKLSDVSVEGRCVGHCFNRDERVAVDMAPSEITFSGVHVNRSQPNAVGVRCRRITHCMTRRLARPVRSCQHWRFSALA